MPAGSSSSWPIASQIASNATGSAIICSRRTGDGTASARTPARLARSAPAPGAVRVLSTIAMRRDVGPALALQQLVVDVAGLVARLDLSPVAARADHLELGALIHFAEQLRL